LPDVASLRQLLPELSQKGKPIFCFFSPKIKNILPGFILFPKCSFQPELFFINADVDI
jgi:hypothetical protein